MSDNYTINTFPAFNAHVDEAMQYLTGDEYKILSFAQRHIYGWKDDDPAKGKSISLSMFEKGFTTKNGKHFGGTGLGRTTIINNLVRLVKYGLLVEQGKPTSKGQVYTIGKHPDIEALANDPDSVKRQIANQKRGEKMTAARLAKLEGGTSHVTGTSDDTSTSHVPPSGTSHVTGTGTSHDTQLNTKKPTETHLARVAEFQTLKDWTWEQYLLVRIFKELTHSVDFVPISNETKRWQGDNKRAADQLIKAGVSVEMLEKFYKAEYTNGYTPSSLVEILRKIGAWLTKQTPAAPTNGTTNYADEMKALTEQRYREKGLLK